MAQKLPSSVEPTRKQRWKTRRCRTRVPTATCNCRRCTCANRLVLLWLDNVRQNCMHIFQIKDDQTLSLPQRQISVDSLDSAHHWKCILWNRVSLRRLGVVDVVADRASTSSVLLVFSGVFTFLVDAYPLYAASALAANSFTRSSFAAAFPLFGVQSKLS